MQAWGCSCSGGNTWCAGRGAGGAIESWMPPLPLLGYPAEPAWLHPLALSTQHGQGVGAGTVVDGGPGALCSPQVWQRTCKGKVLNWMNVWNRVGFGLVFFFPHGLAQGQEGLTVSLGHGCCQRSKIRLFLKI